MTQDRVNNKGKNVRQISRRHGNVDNKGRERKELTRRALENVICVWSGAEGNCLLSRVEEVKSQEARVGLGQKVL